MLNYSNQVFFNFLQYKKIMLFLLDNAIFSLILIDKLKYFHQLYKINFIYVEVMFLDFI